MMKMTPEIRERNGEDEVREREKSDRTSRIIRYKIISELMEANKNKIINNTIQKEKKYSIWERIMKTLGIH